MRGPLGLRCLGAEPPLTPSRQHLLSEMLGRSTWGTCPWVSPKLVLRADRGRREFQLTDESLLKTGPRMTHIHVTWGTS